MGQCCKFFLLITATLTAWTGYKVYETLNFTPPVPVLASDHWWGPGKPTKSVDKSIREFKLEFKSDMINDLQARLSKAKFYTEPIEGVGFEYGFNNIYLKEVVQYWQNEYRFDERLKYLNQYPHFKTNIQGLEIHFVHVKPKNVPPKLRIVPLLLVHGWPGSFVEFYKVIPMLTTPRKDVDFVFELIIPSIPGFAFSQAPSKSDLAEGQIAVVFKNLMDRLGYEKFIGQGGDWGAGIINNMAILYPESFIGVHTNFPFSSDIISAIKMSLSCHLPSFLFDKQHQSEKCPMSKILFELLLESGYFHIQSTKPDTIGVALRDSPVGLAAYILEKFSTWTNNEWRKLSDGGLKKKFSMTELLDNVMIYWMSESITTSMRIYAESVTDTQYRLNFDFLPILVPSAVAKFKHEVIYQTEGQIRSRFLNLVQLSVFSEGGHFPAFEESKVFADDIWSAASKFEDYHKTKKTKTEL
ncbi:juvenile hormone epoxide hydrolase 2-like isoform X2 [Arctopsyche grandis]